MGGKLIVIEISKMTILDSNDGILIAKIICLIINDVYDIIRKILVLCLKWQIINALKNCQ